MQGSFWFRTAACNVLRLRVCSLASGRQSGFKFLVPISFRSNTIEAVKFVDGYKTLGHADVSRYGDALERIRNNPKALAMALVKVITI